MKRLLPILLGLLLLTLFVWFAGPLFAFADYRPLESVRARLIAIVVMVAVWGLSVALKRVRASRASDKLVQAAIKPAAAEPGRPNADVIQLRERFEEAMATLKGKRRSGHSLYELPWYVIIGPPGSGKSTALVNSGLKFPLEEKTGRNALRGVGGTRNCDWWFTNEAVFLDTAGRFFTQDSDAMADSAAWLEFLSLLRKYRKRRPVNGLILTISAQELLMPGHVDLDGYVDAARRRLKELNRELRIQLPVYVTVTKCDLVSGFTEHFDDLTQEGRAQVWGITFPYEHTLSGEAARSFPAEFDALVERLNGRLFARIEEDRDVRRRVKIFGFPQQLASLRDALAQFTQSVFASTRYDQQQTLLRGVYFTSGTQEGMPIDRLLGAIGRRFSLAPDAVAPAGRGKAYFIHRLLKDVIFAESGIAGVNRRVELQKAAVQLGAYAAMLAATVAAVVLLSVSYARNHGYLEAVGVAAAKLNDVPAAASAAPLDSALPRLNTLREVVASAHTHDNDTPWLMRWGLYQGSALGEAADEAYARELNRTLLPHVGGRFLQRVNEHAAQPELLYDYLKAYLMLVHPEHADKNHLTPLAAGEWEAAYVDVDRRAQLAQHFDWLVERRERLRPVALNEPIVASARSTLEIASKPGLIYRYIKNTLGSGTANGLRLDVAAGVGADRVLRRKSGVSLSEPVPSLYTKPIFEQLTNDSIDPTDGVEPLVRQFLDESWVWGETRPATLTATAGLKNEVLTLYEDDYIRFWDGVVNDIAAAPLTTLDQAKEAVAVLGAPTSPLRGLLRVVDEHTYLVKPPDPAAKAPGVLGGRIGDLMKRGRAAIGAPATTTWGTKVTTHFEPIHRLVAADGGPPQIDGVLGQLNQLQQQLQGVGNGVGLKPPGDPATIAAISNIEAALAREAAPLPSSVGDVVTDVAQGATAAVRSGVQYTLETRYQQEVVRQCMALVANKYPFAPNGPDVPVQDFGSIFGYGGTYDTFYKTELANLVDRTGGRWRWLPDPSGRPIGRSAAMLQKFEEAERIREMFFRPGSTDPELRFTATPDDLDPGALGFTLDIDGHTATYRHDVPRAVAITWPGPKAGASITFQAKSGAPTSIARDGRWAWFKLIDLAQQPPQKIADDRYRFRFEQQGHWAEVLVDAGTVRNPFATPLLRGFRCQ